MIKISTYIHFTKEQREQARRTDLANFLISQGEKVKKSGSEYEWLDGSQKVTIRGHLWYHQYEQKGGDAVDFVRIFYNKDYAEAVEMLLNNCGGQIITSPPIERVHKSFELSPRNDRMSRVFSYLLLTRGIDKDVLFEFAWKKMIYESAYYHNAVFVGYDSSGKPRHAHKRGTVTVIRIKEMLPAVSLSSASTGTVQATKYFYLKLPLICFPTFQCTRKIGKNTAMRHPAPFRTGCFFNV